MTTMTGTIQIPSKGDGLKAAWGASVANGINALMPMAPAHMLVREGAGGVGCEPLPQNLRDRRAAKPDLGRYKIESITVHDSDDEDDQKTLDVTLGNPYFRCGGKTYEGSAKSLEDVELPAVVALKIYIKGETPSDELAAYADLEELREAERDVDYYIVPLYLFDESGTVACDFRIGPDPAMFEFANPTGEHQ